MIDVKRFAVGIMGTNCYVVRDNATDCTAVIDPGDRSDALIKVLDSIGKDKVQYILLTHGHFDHIAFAEELSCKYDAKIVISALDEPFLSDSSLNLSGSFSAPIPPFYADIKLSDGDTLSLGDSTLRFILTPGHTQGSGCYIFEDDKVIFSGDTLFCGSMGRVDFPTGNVLDMQRSLHRLRDLKGDFKVYPGHDRDTTLDYEREYNMYLR